MRPRPQPHSDATRRVAAAEPASKARGPRSPVVVIAAVVVLVTLLGGAAFLLGRGTSSRGAAEATTAAAVSSSTGNAPATSAAASDGQSPTPAPTPPSSTPPSADDRALQQLQALRDATARTVVLDSRWVAQVASKNVGVVDPMQTTRSGSHTFNATDIYDEVQSLRERFDSRPVYVLKSTDFGKSSTAAGGQPYWTTLVDGDFSSADDVRAWCTAAFPELSTEQRNNSCAARRLSPPA